MRARRPRRLPLFLNGRPPPAPASAKPPPHGGGLEYADESPPSLGRLGRANPKRAASGRRGRSSAVFTRSLRPSTSWPSNCLIAAAAASSLENSTKAKPRERPVSRSVPIWTCVICPAAERASESCCSVVRKLRLPTKILVEMARLLSLQGLVQFHPVTNESASPSIFGRSTP